MAHKHFPYAAYMLRLWLENHEEQEETAGSAAVWRASLEVPHTQEKRIFANLEVLYVFLLRETERLARGESNPERNQHLDM